MAHVEGPLSPISSFSFFRYQVVGKAQDRESRRKVEILIERDRWVVPLREMKEKKIPFSLLNEPLDAKIKASPLRDSSSGLQVGFGLGFCRGKEKEEKGIGLLPSLEGFFFSPPFPLIIGGGFIEDLRRGLINGDGSHDCGDGLDASCRAWGLEMGCMQRACMGEKRGVEEGFIMEGSSRGIVCRGETWGLGSSERDFYRESVREWE